MKKTNFLVLAVVFSFFGFSQQFSKNIDPSLITSNAQRNCATQDVHHELIQKGLATSEQIFEKWMSEKKNTSTKSGALYTIPVVIHIIHNSTETVGQGRNISNAQAMSQIDVLNEDFTGTNPDTSNVPTSFLGDFANCDIEFCLAKKYPSGHVNAGQIMPEAGINRVDASTLSGVGNTSSGYSTNLINSEIKPKTFWNPDEVMNIWVVQISGGILGYAQFPSQSGLSGLNGSSTLESTDGVVIGPQYFGRTGSVLSAPYDGGRTTTHEVGHWLGLRHINGDSQCGTDYCADTPTQASLSSGCRTHPSPSCSNSGDMFMNYMDYSDDVCLNMFSKDQKARMHVVMQNSPRRKTLQQSNVCSVVGVGANFSASTTTINMGQSITFTDLSSVHGSAGPINSWAWTFAGGTPSSASTAGPHTVTYANAGIYTVSLTVGDGTNSDTETKIAYITVKDPNVVVCDTTQGNFDVQTDGGNVSIHNYNAAAGLILGNNNYDDNGWAEKISLTLSSQQLTGVIYYFGVAKGSGTANLKGWAKATTGGPDDSQVLYNEPVTISSVTAGGTASFISFAAPISIGTEFFLGYDHTGIPQPTDSLAVYSVTKTTGTTWAKEATNGWVDLGAAYNINITAAILPVVCDDFTGIESIIGDLPEITVMPNPTEGILRVALPEITQINATLFDLNGKQVYNYISTDQRQLFVLDLQDQKSGMYMLRVQTSKGVANKRIIIQ